LARSAEGGALVILGADGSGVVVVVTAEQGVAGQVGVEARPGTGEPGTNDGRIIGTPNTFIFAIKGQ
jgi:hypothetical protein